MLHFSRMSWNSAFLPCNGPCAAVRCLISCRRFPGLLGPTYSCILLSSVPHEGNSLNYRSCSLHSPTEQGRGLGSHGWYPVCSLKCRLVCTQGELGGRTVDFQFAGNAEESGEKIQFGLNQKQIFLKKNSANRKVKQKNHIGSNKMFHLDFEPF